MSNFFFYNFFFLLPIFFFTTLVWVFFIKNNFSSVRLNPSNTNILNNTKIVKKLNYNFVINWLYMNYFILFLSMFLMKLDFNYFWFNHLRLNNLIYDILLLIVSLGLIFFNLIRFYKNSNLNFVVDYFFSIINIIIFIIFFFLSNSFYTFFFNLEVISVCFLYKFSVSKNIFSKNEKHNFSKSSKNYLNMLFFQYWANFFASILLLVVLFSLFFYFGSSDWIFLNLINSINYNVLYINNFIFLVLLWTVFFISFLLKLSFPPYHFFKIEIYKGLSLVSIFFYTTFYFLSFFLYFVLFFFYFLNSFKIYYIFIFFIFFIISLFLMLFLLFDISFFKNFFAYSSIVNLISFFCIIILAI